MCEEADRGRSIGLLAADEEVQGPTQCCVPAALQRGPWYRQMMSGRPALSSDASLPRLLVLGGSPAEGPDAPGAPDSTDPANAFDVFEVLGVSGDVVQVRSVFLFEVGEQLRLRIEHDGAVSDALARVRGHIGPDDARITELEISERTEPRGRSTSAGPGGSA